MVKSKGFKAPPMKTSTKVLRGAGDVLGVAAGGQLGRSGVPFSGLAGMVGGGVGAHKLQNAMYNAHHAKAFHASSAYHGRGRR